MQHRQGIGRVPRACGNQYGIQAEVERTTTRGVIRIDSAAHFGGGRRTEPHARELDVPLDVEHRQGTGNLRITTGSGGAGVTVPDGDGLEDDEQADQADCHANHDLDKTEAALPVSNADGG